MEQRQPSVGDRIGSILLDQIIMTTFAVLLGVPLIFRMIATAMTIAGSTVMPPLSFFGGVPAYVMLLGIALYFCKDSINGRSLAKSILGLQVVIHQTGAPAGALRCLLRNVLCILWPVEFIVVLFSPTRRLGDMIAGTRVAYYDRTQPSSLSWWQSPLALLLAYGLLAAASLPLMQVQKTVNSKIAKETKADLNEPAGKHMEQLLTDSLGDYMTPQVKVYHKQGKDSVLSIDLTLRLTENYLDDEKGMEKLTEMLRGIVYGQYPDQDFDSNVTYVYTAPNVNQSRIFTMRRDKVIVGQEEEE